MPPCISWHVCRFYAGPAWLLTPLAHQVTQEVEVEEYGQRCLGACDALLKLARAGLGDIVARQGAGAMLSLPLDSPEVCPLCFGLTFQQCVHEQSPPTAILLLVTLSFCAGVVHTGVLTGKASLLLRWFPSHTPCVGHAA